jgi:chorismate mutase/prephenate dehydratase
MDRLEDKRKLINSVDIDMARLFERRMKLVKEIGLLKGDSGTAVYNPSRELAVIDNVISAINDHSLDPYAVEFTKDMMEVSKKYQKALISSKRQISHLKLEEGGQAGYQGAQGSYTEQAFAWIYGEKTEAKAYGRLSDLFEAISNGKLSCGVVPFENSSTGGVNAVTDMMRDYDLYIRAETEIRIEHCLLGIKGAMLREIKYVYSHPQALGQCSGFFSENTHLTECSYQNTAFAARDIALWGRSENGAIASKRCAELYGLDIIRENIQDNSRNKTRFIVISADSTPLADATKTSILFTSNHTPGALYKMLEPFYENNINITRIESRPNPRRSFEYFFYLDFNGNTTDENIMKALDKARESCGYFRILGSYKVM